MGILGFIKGQFIDVIDCFEESDDNVFWRFPMNGKDIMMNAQLIVRPAQNAIFVNEGQIADVFTPGTWTLTTQNMPVMTKLKSWKYGFESPFKSDVYFISTKLYNDLKWGTSNPIMMRDADFGMLRIRAFGIYSIKVVDAGTFLKQLVGTNGVYTVPDISEQLRKTIMSRFTDALGEAKIPALDLAAKYDELSEFVKAKLQDEFKTMGLELSKFFVENISLPEEVEAMMDKRTGVGMMAPVMGAYTQMQVADAIPLAAQNPSGIAGMGMGVGLGFGMGNVMGQQMTGAAQQMGQQPFPAGNAAASATPAKSLKEELTDLKELFDGQLISQAEFDASRAVIMKKHGMG